MAQVLIRNLDSEVLEKLKFRAANNGRALEQELRDILTKAAPLTSAEKVAASERLRAGFSMPEGFDVKAAIRAGRDDEDFDSDPK